MGWSSFRQCLGKQWFRFAFGSEETADDACALAALYRETAAPDESIQALILAVTQTDGFLYRRPYAPTTETLP